MTADVPEFRLDNDLALALRHLGLDAVAEDRSFDPADVRASAIVQFGGVDVALVTESPDGSDARLRAERVAGQLLRRKYVKYAVAVCYAANTSGGITEESRYAWHVFPNPGTDSDWTMGEIADLAFTIALSPAAPREPGDAARALVDNLTGSNAGTLVNALPFSAATSENLMELRRTLVEAYHVDLIIASHDSKCQGFSGEGRRPEVLLVCRAKTEAGERPPVARVINLTLNPSKTNEMVSIASGIRKAVISGRESAPGRATVQEVESNELAEGDWSAVRLLSPYLRQMYKELRSGYTFRTTRLGAIAEVGPTGSAVRRAFTLDSSLVEGTQQYGALWGHDNEKTRMMRAKTDTVVWAHPEKLESALHYLDQRSRLLLPVQPYLPKVRSMAVRLDEPALGSMWTNCRINMPEQVRTESEKALCMYLNSTVGILAMLGGATRRDGFRRLSPTVKELKHLVVPDFPREAGALIALAETFDELGESRLLPLAQSDTCPVRSAIDDAVSEALGIRDGLVQSIRLHLVAEPSVKDDSGAEQKCNLAEGQQLSLPMLSLF